MSMPSLTGGRAFAALTATFLVVMTGVTLPTPMYDFYQRDLGFSLSTATVIYAVYAAGVLAALLLFGRWSDVLGRRPVLLAGVATTIASDIVFLLADATWVLMLARVLSGLSAGVFVGAATAAVVEAAPEAWRSRAPLVATCANIGGLGLGPLLAAVLVDTFAWPTHLAFAVHLVLSALTVGLLLAVPETVERRPGERPAIHCPAVPAAARSTFIGASIAGFAGFAVAGLLTAVSPRLVAQSVTNPSHVEQVLVVALFFGAAVVGQIVLRGLATDLAVNVGCVLLTTGALLLVWALAAESFALLAAAGIVAGVGQGVSFSKGLASILDKVDGHERAGVSSAFFVVAYVAISLPVIGEGVAAQHVGLTSSSVAFSVGAAALAALALVSLLVDQRRAAAD
jgi:predicted MFS family arabinose efflux permease